MTPQELKNSILQLAIQGKLVEQRPEEGTAAELLEKILAAKGNLTRRRGGAEDMSGGSRSCATGAGEGKGGLKHLPKAALTLHGTLSALSASPRETIPDDEKPFDIPESWEWVRLGDVFQHNTGKALNSSDKTGTPLSYITTSNVYWNRFELGKLKTMLFSEAEVKKCTIQKGDLLVLEGGDVGRAAIWNYDFPMRIQNHIHRLRPLIDICVQYVYYIFMLYKNANLISGKGISIKGLSANSLHNLALPLPPLAEQKRIVAKIEELLPLIDRYEKAWSKLEDFNRRFPVDMQKSVLQMAIQGKLVDQRPEEGTGEELLEKILAAKNAKGAKKNLMRSRGARGEKNTSATSASPREEISDDEKPFDIPESWVWVRLKDIGEIVTGATPNKSESNLYGGQYPFYKPAELDQGYNVIHAKETLSDVGWRKARRLSVGSVLVTCIGATIGKTGIIRREGSCNQQINAIIPCEVVPEYLYYMIISEWFQSVLKADASRTTLPIMNKSKFENLMIPLPPLAEQKRIVAKLEEILPLCERLK